MYKKLKVLSLLCVLAWALSGCALIGPAVSLGGMALTGPLQYAGTVYAVCEYSYEYAVNDNTPDEVIENKFEDFTEMVGLDQDQTLMASSSGPRLTLNEKREMAQDKVWLSSLAFRSSSETGMKASSDMHLAMNRAANRPYTFDQPEAPEGN